MRLRPHIAASGSAVVDLLDELAASVRAGSEVVEAFVVEIGSRAWAAQHADYDVLQPVLDTLVVGGAG